MQRNETQTGFDQVVVAVSEDRLGAWLELPHRAHPDFVPPTPAAVVAEVKRAGVNITDEVRARLEEYLQLLSGFDPVAESSELPERYQIATGRAAVDAEDAEFTWCDGLGHDADRSEDEQVNYYTLNATITVNPETTIGSLKQAKPSKPGVDVFGRDVLANYPRPKTIAVGSGLRLEENGDVVTTAAGRVVERHGEMRVEEVLEIEGDVDFETGLVDSAVNVLVRGAVRTNFTVKSAKSLTVHGTIEAAYVGVAEDVTCMKGLVGKLGDDYVRAGGIITARFANEANLIADGGIRIARSAMGSELYTRGELLIENGAVIGGSAYAREGATARTLGSDAGVKTHLIVGTDPYVLARCRVYEAEMKQRQKMADQIREKVQPLMAQLKRLTAEQRERATELLSKADELELQIDDLRQKRESELAGASPVEQPRVLVACEVHPGVCVSIGLREVVFEQLLHGPVQIEERKVKNVTEIVAVNKSTGSVTVLPSRKVDLDQYAPADEPAEESNDAKPQQ